MKTLMFFTILSFILCSSLLFGQTNNEEQACKTQFDSVLNRTIYTHVDTMPEFPGGDEALLNFLNENLKYPRNEIDFSGTVYLSFVVEFDGNLTDKKIIRGIGGVIDKEALRVLNLMPKWKAGKCKGVDVPVRIYFPIKFIID